MLRGRERHPGEIALIHNLRVELVGDELRPVEGGRTVEITVVVSWMVLSFLVALPAAKIVLS